MPTGDTPKEEIYAKRSGPRELYDVKCSKCGIETVVPFKPNPDWKSYCRDCYAARQAKKLGVPKEELMGPLAGEDLSVVPQLDPAQLQRYLSELEAQREAALHGGSIHGVESLTERITNMKRLIKQKGLW